LNEALATELVCILRHKRHFYTASGINAGPSVVPPSTEIIYEYDALRSAVEAIAERFRAVFERHVWQPFEADGMPPDRIPELTNHDAQLTELATTVVVTELQERFAEFAADNLDRVEPPETGKRRVAVGFPRPQLCTTITGCAVPPISVQAWL
jgi:hypothetical protein